MADKLRVYGVPGDLADGSEVLTEASTSAPLVNPEPATVLSEFSTRAEASAALLKLAQEDGWAGLYNPGDDSTVTLDGSGNIVEIRDAMGNLSPAVRNASAPGTTLAASMGSMGSFVSSSASGYFVADVGVGPWGLLQIFSRSTSGSGTIVLGDPAAVPVAYVSLAGASTPSAGVVYTDGVSSVVASSNFAVPAGPWKASEPVIGDFQADGSLHVGVHRINADDPDVQDALDTAMEGYLPSKLTIGYGVGSGGSTGPVFVSNGPISAEARKRANDLLARLSGGPMTAQTTDERELGAYFVREPGANGRVHMQFRPDFPQQLASMTKVWTCHLAYKILMVDNAVDPLTWAPLTQQFVVEPTARVPVVYEGDLMRFDDMFHASLMVSHNQITDAIAYHAGTYLSGSTDFTTAVNAFVAHMNSEALAKGWSEAVFTTPQGRYDSILTARHYADLLEEVFTTNAYLADIMTTSEWTWELVRLNPRDPEVPPGTVETGVWRSMARGRNIAYSLPEMMGGKTGDTPVLADGRPRHTIGVQSRPAVNAGEFWYTIALDTRGASLSKYEVVQALWDAAYTRYGRPEGWAASQANGILSWDQNGPSGNEVTFYPNPRGRWEGTTTTVSPINSLETPAIRLNVGDRVSGTLNVGKFSGNDPVRVKFRLSGGLWTTGSDTITVPVTNTPGGVTVATVTNATAKRAGLFEMFIETDHNDEGNFVTGVRTWDAFLAVAHVEQTISYSDMELIDYSVTENAQPRDDGTGGGAVGSMSASLVMPVSGSVVNKYGSGWLKDREAQIFTDSGAYRATIASVTETDETTLSISGTSALQRMVSLRTKMEPFEGTLESYLYRFVGLIQDIPMTVQLEPQFQSVGIVAPFWEGGVWDHLKMLGAAYGFNVRLDGFVLRVEGAPGAYTDIPEAIGVSESQGEAQRAKFVEVTRLKGGKVTDWLVYPPGGFSYDNEIVTLAPGEIKTVRLETETSLTSIKTMKMVTRVEKDGWQELTSSVFSVIDDFGNPVSYTRWVDAGGGFSTAISEDRKAVLLTLVAPREMGRTRSQMVRSYSLSTQMDQGVSNPVSTIRILGSGVNVKESTVRVPTGDSSAMTEVGERIDNPFVVTNAQAFRIGALASMKYGGFSPSYKIQRTRTELGDSANRQFSLPSYDYRITGASHSPSGTSLDAEYSMSHETYADLYPGATYADIETGMTDPDPMTYGDDQIIGKRRPE